MKTFCTFIRILLAFVLMPFWTIEQMLWLFRLTTGTSWRTWPPKPSGKRWRRRSRWVIPTPWKIRSFLGWQASFLPSPFLFRKSVSKLSLKKDFETAIYFFGCYLLCIHIWRGTSLYFLIWFWLLIHYIFDKFLFLFCMIS